MRKFERFRVFESRDWVFVVGSTRSALARKEDGQSGSGDHVLKLFKIEKGVAERSPRLENAFHADGKEYSPEEMENELASLAEDTKRTGGLNHVMDAVALLGCVRFVKGFYLVLVTSRLEEGEIDGHKVYSAKGSELVPVFNDAKQSQVRSSWSLFAGSQDPLDTAEEEFKNLFRLIDLSKSFYWSYTFNLTMSVQNNYADRVLESAECLPRSDDRFVWNSFLRQPILDSLRCSSDECPWVVSLIHGSFRQQRCSIFSRSLTITLIGRRSRFFAGTRYLKRGVSDNGDVANDVEVEQIVQDHMFVSNTGTTLTSFVQVRGSIPTFWSQDTSVAMPRPPIKRNRSDPWYNSTRLHFANLMERYGDALIVLNLVKQSEKHKRETIVGNDFKHAVEHINAFLPPSLAVEYRAVDFTRLSKSDPSSLLRALDRTAREALTSVSFFRCSGNALGPRNADPDINEWINVALSDERYILSLSKTRREAWAKLPMRWSMKRRAFVPMRINTAVRIPSRQLRRLYSTFSFTNNHGQNRPILIEDLGGLRRRSFRKSSSMSSFNSENAALDLLTQNPLSLDIDDDDEDELVEYDSDGLGSEEHGEDGTLDNPSSSVPFAISLSTPPSPSRASPTAGNGFFRGNNLSPSKSWKSPPSPRKSNLSQQSSAKSRTNSNSSSPFNRETEGIQRGVIRSNCIDCLDRTNLAQFLIGLKFLNEQLISLGVLGKQDRIGTDSSVSSVLMEMYEELGDRIAHQYGGSDAHRKGSKLVSNASSSSRQKALYTSLKRYYSNAFTDHAKQDAINVFLGAYRREHHHRISTETIGESQYAGDFYLHNRGVTEQPDFSLDPVQEINIENDWWKRPLKTFSMQIVIPLQAALYFGSEVHRNHRYQKPNPHNPSPRDLGALTSFDLLFSRTYFQPIELSGGEKKGRKREIAAQTTSHVPPELLLRQTPAVQPTVPQQQYQLNRSGRTFKRYSSFDSNISEGSVGTHSSTASSVYQSLRNTFFSNASVSGLSQKFLRDELADPDMDSSTQGSEKPRSPDFTPHSSVTPAPIYVDYVNQAQDLFGTLCPFATHGKENITWNAKEHEAEYKSSFADFNICEDDGWGMRRLQAYSSATSIIMHGPYKGYSRNAQASILSLTLPLNSEPSVMSSRKVSETIR